MSTTILALRRGCCSFITPNIAARQAPTNRRSGPARPATAFLSDPAALSTHRRRPASSAFSGGAGCGEPIQGIWINRTKLYNARLRGKEVSKADIESIEEVVLSPLPCWSHLEKAIYRERVAELLEAIEATGRANDSKPALSNCAHERPLPSKRSPAPYFHCASKRVRCELFEAYCWFVASYREATERLSRGDPLTAFPESSFPPHLPYVAHA